eukprot:9250716-Alexandrium_andersonii.AAC.1
MKLLPTALGHVTVRTLGPRRTPRLPASGRSEVRHVRDVRVVHLDARRGVDPVRGLGRELLEFQLVRQGVVGE